MIVVAPCALATSSFSADDATPVTDAVTQAAQTVTQTVVNTVPAQEQAEAHQPVGIDPEAIVGLAPVPGEAVEPGEFLLIVAHGHLLLATGQLSRQRGSEVEL